MRRITYRDALREALREEMLRDERIFVMGEDIGEYGGQYKVTEGLVKEFGESRVRDTPISEAGFVGAAVGAALTGMRPVVEIMFNDFLTCCMDQIVNAAAKTKYVHGGGVSVPVVIRTPGGARCGGPVHSQCLESWFIHVPGLKVVMPSSPYDAKGLLKTAIRDDSPVMFFEHKEYTIKGEVPEEEYTIPLGRADIKREGSDVTVLATSRNVFRALEAGEELEKQGINIEVLDLRTLVPLDKEAIVDSIKKTKRAVVVEEGVKTGGVGAEIIAVIMENAFDYLDAPVERVAALDAPIPNSMELMNQIIPGKGHIVDAIRKLVQ